MKKKKKKNLWACGQSPVQPWHWPCCRRTRSCGGQSRPRNQARPSPAGLWENECNPSPETTELSQGKGAQVGTCWVPEVRASSLPQSQPEAYDQCEKHSGWVGHLADCVPELGPQGLWPAYGQDEEVDGSWEHPVYRGRLPEVPSEVLQQLGSWEDTVGKGFRPSLLLWCHSLYWPQDPAKLLA